MSQNLENTAENPEQGQNFSDAPETAVDSFVLAPLMPAADKTPFVSRFNQWM